MPIQAMGELMLRMDVHFIPGDVLSGTFTFTTSAFFLLVQTTRGVSVPCDQVSHLVVQKAHCIFDGGEKLAPDDSDYFLMSKACIPGLPRRLDFLTTVGPDDISPDPFAR